MRANELITEKPSLRDTLATTLRAAGDRGRNTAMANIGGRFGGGHKAQGRLAVRNMADRMLHAWLVYQGATDLPATPKNVYDFMEPDYASGDEPMLDDETLRKLTGFVDPPVNPWQQPAPAPSQQNPTATAQPAAKPVTQPVGNASPVPTQQPVTQPVTQPVAQAAAPKPAEPAQAPLAAASAPPQPIARVRSTADIMQQDKVLPRQAEKIQQQEMIALSDQQAAARTAKAAKAQAPAAQPVAQQQQTRPQQAPAAPSASPMVSNLLQQIGNQVAKPQPNAKGVMQMIATALGQTRPGTPERQNMVAMIKMLQNNANMVAKVPQLSQVAVEGRRVSGRMLREAAQEQLSRSDLDRIFVGIAKELIRVGRKPPLRAGQSNKSSGTNDPQQQQQQKNTAALFQQAQHKSVSLANFEHYRDARRNPWDRESARQIQTIGDTLKNAPKSLKDLKQVVYTAISRDLTAGVQNLLVNAAR